MADTSLGRASLSVTADLSGFTTSLDTASSKIQAFGNTSVTAALEANKVTTSTEKVVQSLEQLQQAAVAGSINVSMFKQSAAAAKLAVDQMVLLDGATLLLMKDENELQFQQAKLTTEYKELENTLMRTDAAFRNNALLIELNTQKQKNLAMESKLTIAKMLSMDDAAIGMAVNQKTMASEMDLANRKLELQARQMMLDTGATKALHDELVKLEEQEKALAAAEDKVRGINQPVPVVEAPKIDTNTPEYVRQQMNLKSETDLATKALELQARQMNVDSGATKKLHDEMVRLEQIEQKLIAAENKARGIPPPLPIQPPPIPENKNTVQYVSNARKMAQETDILNRKLEIQARQLAIDSGAAAKLAAELSALEKAEKKLADAEAKINAAAGMEQGAKDKIKSTPAATKINASGMGIKDYLGIGFFTSAFTKIFDGIMSMVGKVVSSVLDLGHKVIEAGSKFQEVDNRLKAMTGFRGIGKGLQEIMKTGPSASFNALSEAATRLAGMKFRPDAIAGLIKDFNRLGIALGNPEKIVSLITDKIADMATNGAADMASLGKIADEQIPVFEALAARMGVSIDEAKRRVAAGLVSVSEAAQAIADAANMPNMLAAAEESARSFSGIWSRVTNNIEVIFQNIGASILKGFGLVDLGDSITNFFDNIGNRIKDLEPMFEKIGAFAANVSQLIMDEISTFLFGWQSFTDDTSAEDMMASMRDMAQELVAVLKRVVDVLIETAEATMKASKDVSWWANLGSNTAQSIQNWIVNPLITVAAATGEFVLNVGEWSDGIETIGNGANSAANQLNNLNTEMQNTLHWAAQLPQDTFFPSGAGGSFQTDLEAMNDELAAFDEQWQQLHDDMVNKPLRIEEPGWKKFFAENISSLQQYENEIDKLRMMLDGSEEGFMAFSIGSANALKKLKDGMGLGGEQKFASAVTLGTADDFKASIDAQSKTRDIQQEIKMIMEAANEIQQQQLDAQLEIGRVLANQPKPRNVVVAMGGN